jgi:amidase
LFASHRAAEGSAFTACVDAGGLVTIGKTATSELGLLGSTETLLEGVTHNPWDLAGSAVGSSGGAAAAVAAGIVPLAHASDGGGSIRIPASVAGLFGLKPSRGRSVPANAQRSEFDAILSEGCISRSVRDSEVFSSLVAAPEHGELPAFTLVRGPSARRRRIGYLSTTLLGTEPAPECRRALESSVALCSELGHELVPMPALGVDGPALSRGFFTLAGNTLAGMVAMLEPMLGRAIGEEDLEPFTLHLIRAARAAGPAGLEQARVAFRAATARYLDAVAGFDVVLTPTLARPAWPLGWLSPLLPGEELIARTEQAVCYTPIHSIVGCPAMSVPLYWSAAGEPIGSHFAAPRGREDVLFGLAYELERARPWADRWAPSSFVAIARA